MPFDSTKLRQRQPSVTVLPPTTQPPERGGGPQRVHVTIEINDKRAIARAQRQRSRWVMAVLIWAIVIGILATLARADNGGPRYDHWQDTNGSHGEVRRQGTTTDWTAYGPRGEQKHCHRYFVGDQPYTNCN